jgi:hypothetical protein
MFKPSEANRDMKYVRYDSYLAWEKYSKTRNQHMLSWIRGSKTESAEVLLTS